MESDPPSGGIAKQARKQLESQTVKAELPGTWGCERLGEAFAAEAVGWMDGLWGRWREIESLDSDSQTLYF